MTESIRTPFFARIARAGASDMDRDSISQILQMANQICGEKNTREIYICDIIDGDDKCSFTNIILKKDTDSFTLETRDHKTKISLLGGVTSFDKVRKSISMCSADEIYDISESFAAYSRYIEACERIINHLSMAEFPGSFFTKKNHEDRLYNIQIDDLNFETYKDEDDNYAIAVNGKRGPTLEELNKIHSKVSEIYNDLSRLSPMSEASNDSDSSDTIDSDGRLSVTGDVRSVSPSSSVGSRGGGGFGSASPMMTEGDSFATRPPAATPSARRHESSPPPRPGRREEKWRIKMLPDLSETYESTEFDHMAIERKKVEALYFVMWDIFFDVRKGIVDQRAANLNKTRLDDIKIITELIITTSRLNFGITKFNSQELIVRDGGYEYSTISEARSRAARVGESGFEQEDDSVIFRSGQEYLRYLWKNKDRFNIEGKSLGQVFDGIIDNPDSLIRAADLLSIRFEAYFPEEGYSLTQKGKDILFHDKKSASELSAEEREGLGSDFRGLRKENVPPKVFICGEDVLNRAFKHLQKKTRRIEAAPLAGAGAGAAAVRL